MMIFAMISSPNISLIFVNYHSAWQLSLALKSLFLLEESKSFEVIVVNNDPRERFVLEYLQKNLSFLLIQNIENKGFASAANHGARFASGQILGFINPDTLWCQPTLAKIQNLFFTEKKLGVFGMTLLDSEREHEKWSGGKFPSLAMLLLNNLSPFSSRRTAEEKEFFEWVSGGGFFISRSIFEELEGFDENFFLYFEDADLCLRVRKAEYAVMREPYMPLIHTGGKSSSSLTVQKKYFYESQKKFFRKNRPHHEFMVLQILHFLLK